MNYLKFCTILLLTLFSFIANAAQLSQPTLNNPLANALYVPLFNQNFNWSSVVGATSYRLVVSESASFNDFNDTGTDTSSCTNTTTCKTAKTSSTSYNGFFLKSATKYYWQIRAGSSTIQASEWSQGSFTTFNEEPTLESSFVSPNTITLGQSVTFESVWSDPEERFIVDVEVRYRKEGESGWTYHTLDYISNSVYTFRGTYVITGLSGRYEYELRASDSDSDAAPAARTNTTLWKPAGTFTVNSSQLERPALYSPASSASNIPLFNQNFSWSIISNATTYRLVVSKYSDFRDFNDTGTDTSSCTNTTTCKTAKTSSTSYNGFFLEEGVQYYWKVRSGSATIQSSEWSVVRTFITLIDTGSPAPDLIVEGTSVDNTSISIGQSLSISSTIRNIGDQTSNSSRLRYYSSPDATITSSDNELSGDNFSSLAPNETSFERDRNIINTAGVIYVGVCADGVTGETQLANNCSNGIRIDVNTDPLAPDITIESFNIDKNLISSGEQVTLSTVVKNSGSATSTAGSLQYYYSTDAVISPSDTRLGGIDSFGSMLAGGTAPRSESINISLPSGYLGACADPISGEKTGSNNCSVAKQITVTVSQYNLSVSTTGIGTGTVISNPAGINCSSGSTAGCSKIFDAGTAVILQVTHPVSSYFTTWGGDCAFRADLTNCSLIIGGNKTVTADFASSVPILSFEDSNLQGSPSTLFSAPNTEIQLYFKAEGNVNSIELDWFGDSSNVESKTVTPGSTVIFSRSIPSEEKGRLINWSATAYASDTTIKSNRLTGGFYVAEKVGDCSSFIQDVTIPDGSRILVNTPFTKTWEIKNCGTNPWNNYTLVHDHDLNLSSVSTKNITNGIAPGQNVNVSLAMTAPNTSGRKKSSWKAQNASGVKFGTDLYASIDVYTTPSGNGGSTKSTGDNAVNDIAQTDETGVCVKDPINSATGGQSFVLNLLSVSGLRNINFVASYNSLVLSTGEMGIGWGHNHQTVLKELADGTIRINWRSNREDYYDLETDGSYTPRTEEIAYNSLVKNADGTFLLTLKSKTTYLFTAAGELVEETNPKGQKLIYSYTDFGLVSRVTEPVSGVYLQFNYDTVFRLTSVNDPIGRDVEFIYDIDGRIEAYKDALDQQTSYTLNEKGQLVSGTNSEGIEFFHNTFDSEGRVVYQKTGRDINDDVFNIDYSSDVGDVTYPITIMDSLGHEKTIVYNDDYLIEESIDELGNSTKIEYDLDKNPIKITDAKNRVTEQTFDSRGNKTSITNVLGHSIFMTYNENDDLTSIKDAEGNSTAYTYDTQHNVLTITDANNELTRFTYTPDGKQETVTTPKGYVTRFEYENGLLARIIDPQNYITQLGYDGAGRLTSLINADGFTSTYVLDNAGRRIEVINHLGHKIIRTFDSRGNLLTATDAELNTTTYEWDGNNNQIKVTDAKGHITQYVYDANERLIKTIDPKGAETTIVYDEKGRVSEIVDTLGHKYQSEYDETDQLIKNIDPLLNETTYVYSDIDELIEQINALNQSISFGHNRNSQIIEVIDQLGRKTQSRFDPLNRLIETTDALDGKASQSFDTDGELVSLVDPNDNKTTFDYNSRSLLIKETTASSSSTQYEHNGRGLVTKVTNARGQVTTNTFDEASRLTKSVDPVGTTDFNYDKNQNLLTVTDAQGTIARTFDELNRTATYTNTAGEKLEYLFDENSNLKTLIYPDGKRVEYSYNELNQLISVVDWAGRGTVYEYNANSLLSKITRPDGSVQARFYNELNQLVEQKDLTATGEIIYQVNYVLDEAGNITEEIINPQPDIEAILSSTMDYTAGNRIGSITRSQESFSIAKTFDFDLDGNTIKAPFNGVDTSLVFNARNQLTSTLGFSYQYDAEGYRTQLTNAENIATRFTVNPEAVLSQVLAAHSESTSTYYVHGLGLIGQEVDGVYHNYHFDYRGSTVALTDNAGVITDRFTYTPFADLASHTGTTETPFQYNGRDGVMNDTNGLYYMRARFYAPEFHRFVNRDMLLGEIANSKGLNRFGYVGGNPIGAIDPTGNVYDVTTDPMFLVAGIAETKRLYDEGSYGWAFLGTVGTVWDVCAMFPVVPAGAGVAVGMLNRASKLMTPLKKLTPVSGKGSLLTGKSTVNKFISPDKHVSEVANAIEEAYPGHVAGVNIPVKDAVGNMITDADILLNNSIIQVKSGGGKGISSQILRTEKATGLPTFGYGPDLKQSILKSSYSTNDLDLLINTVSP